ncbi:hypothetical protein pqer_cds_453 [Pandoravirus quercus]|uniref:DUF5848 domain-containing protein n=2 Tax=Pandoravirus TaxID=2060084 RepID=A0A2U7U913_9VIRU|nr:hypothetical protein pqer_cds_453 [Pandoravirus quercus]AVK74875.1 hypothetical protein pqer_cds_453 [Pandoravirus quercus]QBZ81061.1 hypothetical protein pclt_cds_466 [Pandoravirus celtis]
MAAPRAQAEAGRGPMTWDDVHAWGAATGLDDPRALLALLESVAADEARGQRPTDPRVVALLRALSQEALMVGADATTPAPITQILDVYRPYLTWLAAALTDSNNGDWLEALANPLGTGEPSALALWPPTPLAVLARAEQTIRRLLHYPPTDPVARFLDIYTTNEASAGLDTALTAAESVREVVPGAITEAAAEGRLLGDLAVPAEPVLAGPLTVEAYHRWWPAVGPGLSVPQAPFVLVVARAADPDVRDYAAVIQNDRVIASVGGSDVDGQQRRQREEGVYPIEAEPGVSAPLPPMPQDEESWVQLLDSVARTVRQGRPDLVGLVRVVVAPPTEALGAIRRGPQIYTNLANVLPEDDSVGAPYYAGAFDPADVMAAVEAYIPEDNVARIEQALVDDPEAEATAARAYDGPLGTGETTPEFDVFAAPYVAARGCAADASAADRARLARAARVLGVDPRRFLDRGPLCAELAEATAAARGTAP